MTPGATNSLLDVAGLRVGHHHRVGGGYRTGTTVVLAPPGGMVAGVDVRGAAPGTRETELLDPRNLVERVHAIVLTGGSAYGLSAACGVMTRLADAGIGFPVEGGVVPIVPAAVIYDLGRGGAFRATPDARFGASAYDAATHPAPSPLHPASSTAGPAPHTGSGHPGSDQDGSGHTGSGHTVRERAADGGATRAHTPASGNPTGATSSSWTSTDAMGRPEDAESAASGDPSSSAPAGDAAPADSGDPPSLTSADDGVAGDVASARSGGAVPSASVASAGDGVTGRVGDVAEGAASSGYAPGYVSGSVGAGAGAMAGGLAGGVGTASVVLPSGATVAALAVVNAAGSVLDPGGGRLAGARYGLPGEFGHLKEPDEAEVAAWRPGGVTSLNTTIGVVATDLTLTKAQCAKLAAVAHDGLARAIRPAHTMVDGDTIFAVATCARPAPHGGQQVYGEDGSAGVELHDLLAAGADVFSRAVAHAVLAATGREGAPAYLDVFPSATRTE